MSDDQHRRDLEQLERSARWAEHQMRTCRPQDRWYYEGQAQGARRQAQQILECHPEWSTPIRSES